MNTFKKAGVSSLWGVLCAATAILLSQVLLRSLGVLTAGFGTAAGLETELVTHIAQSLGQLKTAVIISPWLIFLTTGAFAGCLLSWMPHKYRWISVVLAVLMLIPGIAFAVLLSEVNGVLVLHLLRSALPLLAAL